VVLVAEGPGAKHSANPRPPSLVMAAVRYATCVAVLGRFTMTRPNAHEVGCACRAGVVQSVASPPWLRVGRWRPLVSVWVLLLDGAVVGCRWGRGRFGGGWLALLAWTARCSAFGFAHAELGEFGG